MPKLVCPEILNRGSLLTYQVDGQDKETCLGFLLHFPEHGTYDPNFGRVPVSKEEADTHNKLLSEALVEGLDNGCAVGQGGLFYLTKKGGAPVVGTWTGAVVSANVKISGRRVSFVRNGKTFKGTIRKDCEDVFFERIS